MAGTDGVKYPFLCKAERRGDLRKDSRMMMFGVMVNQLLEQHPDAHRRNLHLVTFNVVILQDRVRPNVHVHVLCLICRATSAGGGHTWSQDGGKVERETERYGFGDVPLDQPPSLHSRIPSREGGHSRCHQKQIH